MGKPTVGIFNQAFIAVKWGRIVLWLDPWNSRRGNVIVVKRKMRKTDTFAALKSVSDKVGTKRKPFHIGVLTVKRGLETLLSIIDRTHDPFAWEPYMNSAHGQEFTVVNAYIPLPIVHRATLKIKDAKIVWKSA